MKRANQDEKKIRILFFFVIIAVQGMASPTPLVVSYCTNEEEENRKRNKLKQCE